MPDLIERFRSLDQIDSPDLWREAAGRPARPFPPTRSPRERAIAMFVAFAVAAAAIAYAVSVLSRGTPARPADQPTPEPIQPYANGALYFVASKGEAGASVRAIEQDGSGNHVV